jgi:hypothetical protein
MTRVGSLLLFCFAGFVTLSLLAGCGNTPSSSKDSKPGQTGEQPKKDSDTKPTSQKHEPG